MPDRPARLVSTAVAAEVLGVSRFVVVRWIHDGYLPARRIGRRYWIPTAALDAFVPPTEPDEEPP